MSHGDVVLYTGAACVLIGAWRTHAGVFMSGAFILILGVIIA